MRNFSGNIIKISFDEYVDKRSFIESFSLYPDPGGTPEFDWSGADVTVSPGKMLKKNTTYVISIGKDLKDIRGGNSLDAPLIYAFSTGSRIDTGSISGILHSRTYDRVKLLLFRLDLLSNPDPSKDRADYLAQTNSAGSFSFPYLPDGKYRLFALNDDDRNNLYAPGIELLGSAYEDIAISGGSAFRNAELMLDNIPFASGISAIIRNLLPDSADMIYSNIENPASPLRYDEKLYFFFNGFQPLKQDVVRNFSLSDTAGKTYKPAFNWLSDSLLEVIVPGGFDDGAKVNAGIDLSASSPGVSFTRSFITLSAKSYVSVSGKAEVTAQSPTPVKAMLVSVPDAKIVYRAALREDGSFEFRKIAEGTYKLILFADSNDDGFPFGGSAVPFRHSEKIRVYEKEIKAKGGWNIDNIFIRF